MALLEMDLLQKSVKQKLAKVILQTIDTPPSTSTAVNLVHVVNSRKARAAARVARARLPEEWGIWIGTLMGSASCLAVIQPVKTFDMSVPELQSMVQSGPILVPLLILPSTLD
jgi:hypothetical protein